MNNYETMYIIKPTLDEETVDVVVTKVEDIIKNLGGTIEKTEKRGRKRLAYEVKKFKDGFYVLTLFQLAADKVAEFERLIKINDDVIRHIIVNQYVGENKVVAEVK